MPASLSPETPTRLLRALAGCLVLFFAPSLANAGGGAYEDLPPAVIAALDEVAPDLVFTEIGIEEEDEGTLYEIHGITGGNELEAKLDQFGQFLELKIGDDDDDDVTIPGAITESLGELFPGISVTRSEERSAGGIEFFELEATVGTRQIEIRIEFGGRLLEVETPGLAPSFVSASPLEPGELPAPVAAQVAAYEIHHAVAYGATATLYRVWGSSGNSLITASFGANGELLSYALDRDADGLSDLAEAGLGSDLERWDSDGDDYPDGFEIGERCSPLDASSHPQIISVSADPGTRVIHVGVVTFYGADFTLEQCGDTAGEWTALGASFAGDGTIREFVLPIAEEIGRCFFRISITPKPEESSKRDASSTPVEGHCKVPETINGLEIRFGEDGEGSRSLFFKTPTRGEVVELEDDEVELSPFAYAYERIGECRARVTLTFSTSDGFETEIFTLTFTSDSQGAYISQEFEHGEPEDPEQGDFTLSAN